MTTETLLELYQARLAEGLEPQHVDLLKSLAQDACFVENEVILRENEPFRRLYLILRGQVAIELKTGDGPARVMLLGPGDEFGWSSLLGKTSQFDVIALTFTHALAFAAEGLLQACRDDPSFGAALYRRLLDVASTRLEGARRLTAVAAFRAGV